MPESSETKRAVTAEDLLDLSWISEPQISPAGDRLAFVRKYVDHEKNAYRSEIWVGSTDGSVPPAWWTGGAWSDGEARWSPDGTQIAFVSDRKDERAQIYLLPTGGGEARALTAFEEGSIQNLHWSADGSQIAFLFRLTPPARTKTAIKEREEKGLSEAPRVHTHLSYRLDGFGYFDDSYWQVWTADIRTGDARALTEGAFSCSDPCWSADGSRVAFLSDRRADADVEPAAQVDIWTVPREGGPMQLVRSPAGDKQGLAWSPDGRFFAYASGPDPLDQWGVRNQRVCVLPVGGGEEARDLTGHLDKAVGFLTLSDARDNGGDVLAWSPASDRVLFVVSEDGSTRLYQAPLQGGEPVPLTESAVELAGFSMSADGTRSALALGSAMKPHEVYSGRWNDGAFSVQPLSDLNREWVLRVQLQTPQPFAVPNDGGLVPGWFLVPDDFTADGTRPLVVYVHGGPHLQYGNALFHELQWLAAQGYVVAFANPRGSKGYGERHTKAIKGDWGGPALADVMAVVNHAVDSGYADPRKLSIMGGSYGGYLTAWAVGHTDRFACAIADRLVANIQSMSGTTDFPWSHGTYYKGNAWDDPSDLWRHSPLAYAGHINTPLLLIHSDGDLRCPVSQAEELFAALRLQRKPVEFVRYPSSTSHGMSRSGPPDLRLDRLRRNLAWLDKYLKSASV